MSTFSNTGRRLYHLPVIRLAFPDFGDDEIAAAARVLRSGNLVQGSEVAAFEAALAERTGAPHVVCCASGTSALEIALAALEVGPGDEVVVPSFTFPAPAHVAALAGATVVLADVDAATWNLTAETLAPCLSDATRVVVAVDQLGVPADTDALRALLPTGARLVEDAACAIGGSLRGRPAGTLGDLGTFSFHPRKVVTTGEGGAVLASDVRLSDRLRRLRDHGRAAGTYVEPAGNHRMTEAAAAVGRVQLARLDRSLARRRAIRAAYRAALPGGWQADPAGAESNAQTVAILLPEGTDAAARDRVRAAMRERGVEAGAVAPAAHRLPSLASARVPVPPRVSESLEARAIALPVHTALSDEDVARVCEAFTASVREMIA
jgi:perosamine synthetase